jgi:hypothetical protein
MDGGSKNDDALLLQLLLRVERLNQVFFFLLVVPVLIVNEVAVGLIVVEGVYRPFGGHLLVLVGEVHFGIEFVFAALLLLHHHGTKAAILGVGRVAEQLVSELLQLYQYVLGPRQSLEVLKGLIVLCVQALLHCFVHSRYLLLVVLQKLVLESFCVQAGVLRNFL